MIEIGDIIQGRLSMNSSGSAYLVSDEIPKDIYIHKTNTNKALHLDVVEIRVMPGKGRALEGKVIGIVERFKTEFVGRLQVSKKYAFLIPDSNKMNVDMYIPLDKLMGAKDGQKALGRLTEWKDDQKSPNGEIIEVLGDAGDNNAEMHSILHEYDLPYRFPEDVEAEANIIPLEPTESDFEGRRDMRDVLTFTIDPDTARDFDDALSIEWINGKMQVGVHIADVSHYVRPDSELDKEALARGTSVYLVDRCVPMLPERLSNGVCSLRPHETKLCFSAVFTLDHNGHVLDEWFGRTVIYSDHRFTYEQAQMIIENGEDGVNVEDLGFDKDNLEKVAPISHAVVMLDKVAKKMRAKRFTRGSISINKREVKFKLDEQAKPVGIELKIQNDANRLIEEYMLLANRHVAQYLKKLGVCVNRAHDEPDPLKLQNLKEFIAPLGYDIKTNNPQEITATLNKLLLDVQGKPEENMISTLVVRSMQKAIYTVENIGHYGLGFNDYAHFTSPIRRYPDVLIHRILARRLDGKEPMKMNKLEARCKHLSERERKAQKASRDSVKYKQCEYMADKINNIYEGVVISVMEYGLFVEMPDTGCEGMIRLSEVEGDTYMADVDNHKIVGFNTGHTIKLGDKVMVKVKHVDIERKNIDLSLWG